MVPEKERTKQRKKIKQNETKRTRLVLKPRWQPRVVPVLIYPALRFNLVPRSCAQLATSLPDFCRSSKGFARFHKSGTYFWNWLCSTDIGIMAQVSNSRLRDSQAVSNTFWSSLSICTLKDSFCLLWQWIRNPNRQLCLFVQIGLSNRNLFLRRKPQNFLSRQLVTKRQS